MDVTFRNIDPASDADVECLHRWFSDAELRPFMIPHTAQGPLSPVMSREQIRQHLGNQPGRDRFMIVADGRPVGEMNVQWDPPHLLVKEPRSAWLGISIGERDFQGRGVGFEAMRFLERHCDSLGASRIEIGVFEFNERAYRLYRKLGYREFARTPGFTWWQGRAWADIRLEKRLRD